MRSITVLIALGLAGACAAKTPTIDESLSFHTPGTARISPDDQWIAYTVQETNWDENAFETEIWIAPVSGGRAPYQLTNGKKSSSSPEWSPDSRWLAFLSDRDGKKQIYLIAPAGGEPMQITHSETDIGSMKWSGDGRSIAYAAPDTESAAIKGRKEKYGEFEIVKSDRTLSRLWRIELPADGEAAALAKVKPEQLIETDEFSVADFSWSPDSARIAFAAVTDPSPGASGTSDIYILEVAAKKFRKIVDTAGPDRNPVWSPDGTRIAFETAAGKEFYFYANSRIAIVPVDGGEPRIVSGAFDENPQLLAWSPRGIFFAGSQKTYSHLFLLDPGSKKVERVSAPDSAVYSQFSFTKDFARAAFLAARNGAWVEVAATKLPSFEPLQVTRFSDQYKDFQLARREVIQWKSTDGTIIEGVLIKPADFDASKKYPLLVVIHGGPTGVDRATLTPDRYYPVERFAAKGAVVLRPNYRGSAGYGEAFRSLNVRNLGVGDAWDVVSGVDFLIAQGYIDRDRVGAMGWSQGGYISAFLTTSSDRFKAISVGAGISDWSTYYVNTDITPFTRQYLKATPWDDAEIYRKTSPISYVTKARTPTLIQHGELDKRVPIPNGYELRQALEDRGVPVKMIVYKGFGHGIDKPKQQRAVLEHNEVWFAQWIWGEKPQP